MGAVTISPQDMVNGNQVDMFNGNQVDMLKLSNLNTQHKLSRNSCLGFFLPSI